MAFEPKPGLVLRYDFLRQEEQAAGREDGIKDRPCAVVLATSLQPDGSRSVILCPITHAPVGPDESGLAVPAAVARHLGLDDRPSWIKTYQVNLVRWEAGRIPAGFTPARPRQWSFGRLPDALGRAMFDQVQERSSAKTLARVARQS